ncbi:MAG: cellulase family glycosylhydrolase [Lachnospiraceae bacterium]|nr:cellulase family glycosylhydrolase [Lachnospiraceae bacterium]
MKKRTVSKTICGRLIWIFVLLLLLSACGKKEQTGADAEASSLDAQAEEIPTGNVVQDAQNDTGTAEDEQSGPDFESGDPQDEDSPGAEGTRNGQNAEAQTAQDGQEWETENTQSVQNDETAQGNGTAAAPQPQAAGSTPYGAHGALSVNGTQLVDTYGEPYQLRGVSTHGLSWFPQYANQAAFRTMRDEWGVNVVRLAMYTAEYGGYCVGDENNRNSLKQLVYDSVDAATELGMYVIVDWHVLNDRDPNTYIDQAIAFFRETAERYASYGNVIYEICNEPNGGVSWQRIKTYAEQVIPVIRQQDEDAIIIVGTPTWSQDVDQAAANPITGYENIMYTLHFYADTHRDSLRQKMVNAIGAGLPVFVSEFGICDASGNGAINAAEADKWVSTMDENGVSYCVWNLSNKSETSALLRSSTTATSGWTYDELSESGKWFVDMMGADHTIIGSSGGNAASQNDENGAPSNGGSGNSSSNSGSAQGVTSDGSGSLQASVSLSNSWETDGKHYYQYTLELTNTSGTKVNGWTCEITFDHHMSVSQSWCGSFSASGSSLTITPESYNAAIEAGAAQGNIGFILEADAALTVTGVSCW